jgi:uncharacterized protein YukE
MTKIAVDPEMLQALSNQAQRAATDLSEIGSRLQTMLGGLDWEIHRRVALEAGVEEARGQAGQLSEQTGGWAQFLSQKAQDFAHLDQTMAQALASVSGLAVAAGAVAGAGAVTGAVTGDDKGGGTLPGAVTPQRSNAVPYGEGVTSTNTERWKPVDVPVTSTQDDRSHLDQNGRVDRYNQVLDQFNVTGNPRYLRNGDTTYCNIFVSDATRAMGAEVPHCVMPDGTPVKTGTAGSVELDANKTVQWLEKHGAQYGWQSASPADAQQMANDGRPAVAVMENPGDIGHVAVVRPGHNDPEQGPQIANVGGSNFASTTVRRGFGKTDSIQYFVHQ